MTKTVGSVKTEYCYEGNRLLWEKRGNASIVYTYDHTGINGFIYDMTQYLYVKNIQGDITQIYRISGEKEAEYRYDAFGNCETVYDRNGIGSLNAIRYRGYYYDTETKLYYLINRYYDPELCRFISIDDISYLAPDTINGCNLYTYCGNNPVMRTDRVGTSWGSFWKGVGDWWNNNWDIVVGVVATVGLVALSIATCGIGTCLVGMAVGAVIGAGFGAVNAVYSGDNIIYGAFSGMITGALSGLGGAFGVLASGAAAGTLSLIGDRVNGRERDLGKAGITAFTAFAFAGLGGKVSKYLINQAGKELAVQITSNYLGALTFTAYNFVVDVIIDKIKGGKI